MFFAENHYYSNPVCTFENTQWHVTPYDMRDSSEWCEDGSQGHTLLDVGEMMKEEFEVSKVRSICELFTTAYLLSPTSGEERYK